MLSKLLKYEIKATARTFLPLYAALLVFAAINQLINSLSSDHWGAPEVISMTAYIIILVGMCVMTYIVMIQRFYKNLLSDEGYLMFTLPTKPWMHITGKLLASMLWMVLSGIVAFISIIIIALDKIPFGGIFKGLAEAFGELYDHLGGSFYLFTLEFIIGAVLSLASSILIIYAAIAIGHLFNRHRILASFGAFLVLNTITQILFTSLGTIVIKIYEASAADPSETGVHFLIWLFITLLGIFTAGYFFTTNIILSKRLNLE